MPVTFGKFDVLLRKFQDSMGMRTRRASSATRAAPLNTCIHFAVARSVRHCCLLLSAWPLNRWLRVQKVALGAPIVVCRCVKTGAMATGGRRVCRCQRSGRQRSLEEADSLPNKVAWFAKRTSRRKTTSKPVGMVSNFRIHACKYQRWQLIYTPL